MAHLPLIHKDGNDMQSWWQRFRNASRKAQIGIGCGVLIVACIGCGGIELALSGGGSSATSSSALSPSNDTSQSTTPIVTDTPPPPTVTPKPQQWTTVKTFTGNGISKTDTFKVDAGKWKIVWSCDPSAYGSEYNLVANITEPGQDFGDSVVNVICKSSDPTSAKGETMEYKSGTFYLDVISEASWTFRIQLYQ